MLIATKYLYAPVFWFGFIGLAILAVDWYRLSLWTLIPFAFVAIATNFALEKIAPYDMTWNTNHGDRLRDVAHAVVNESLTAVGLISLPFIAAFMPTFGIWPMQWPLILQVLLAIVLADAGITLAHYVSHKVGWLWRLHAVHHSVKRMYGFNGLMKHPIHQTVESIAGIAPLLLLGASQTVVALVAFAVAIQLLLQHSNVDMRLGALRHVFAFAPVHRFHHMRYDTSGDVNFGLFFTLWDKLLGTDYWAKNYRMSTIDLGIGSRPDFPNHYIEQLTAPFKSAPKTTLPIPEAPVELLR